MAHPNLTPAVPESWEQRSLPVGKVDVKVQRLASASRSAASPGPRYKVAEEEMLDAASAAFASDGFASTKMATIAARAGTTKPTLYARFGSKEALYAAAVSREYDLLKQRLFAAYAEDDGAPFRARLRGWTRAYFEFARDRPDGFKLISEGERNPAAAAIIRRTRDDIIDRIAVLIADVSGRRTQDAARMVAAMISGLVARCAQDAVQHEANLDDAARLCEAFMYPALRALDLDLMAEVDRRATATRRRRR
jgi:AcrR family transcriptional regulator